VVDDLVIVLGAVIPTSLVEPRGQTQSQRPSNDAFEQQPHRYR
jgi:hypothetical protein